MGDTLKRGSLGSKNDPSPVPLEFAGSMAKAMEDALNHFLILEGKDPAPIDNSAESRDRRILFLAISKGIIDHLVANETALKIEDLLNNPASLRIDIANE